MARQIRSRAYCIDGVLDVDWAISPVEDMLFIRDATASGVSHEKQLIHLAEHCLVRIDPEFPRKMRCGDILVGNRGVGWGHGHDHAAMALKAVGFAAILCETTGVNFRRNCINHGLPIIECPGIFSHVTTGDILEINLENGVVINLSNNSRRQFAPYPEVMLKILDAGGIYEQLRIEIENGILPAPERTEVL